MTHWEFLIQEEGNRVWKQIATPAQISPGRYRLVARSTYRDQEIEVRVTHRLETDPPKQRSVARSRQTTPQGLMVVVPFTTFKPGSWEVVCTPVSETETAQYGLQVKVDQEVTTQVNGSTMPTVDNAPNPENLLSPTNEIDKERVAEQSLDPVTAIMSEIAAWEEESTAEAWENADAITQSVNELEQLLKQELDPLLDDSEELYVSEEVEEIPAPPPPADFNLQLDLETNAFVATHGETIALTGTILVTDSLPDDLSDIQLRYQLWHPQNQDLILEISQAIPQLSIPLSFSRSLIVPRQQGTCLLLGEVVLTGKVANADVTLANQPFTITLNVSDILDNILSAKTEREAKITEEIAKAETSAASISAPEKPKPVSLDLPSLNAATTIAHRATETVQMVGTRIIPPKINKPTSNGHKSLKLPSFSAPPPRVTATPSQNPSLPATEEQNETAALTNNPDNQTSQVEADSPTDLTVPFDLAGLPEDLAISETFPEINGIETESPVEDDADLTEASGLETDLEVATVDTVDSAEEEAETNTEDSPEALAHPPENDTSEVVNEQFQSLKLQKRFWHRLNDLATDEEATQWLQEPEAEATPAAETEDATAPGESEDVATLTGDDAEAETKDLTDSDEAVEILEWEEIPSASELEDVDEEDESLVEIATSDSLVDQVARSETLAQESAGIETGETQADATVIQADLEAKEELDTEDGLVIDPETDTTPESEQISETEAETDSESEAITEVEVVPQAETNLDQLEIVLDDEEVVAPPPVIQRDTSGMPYPQGIMPPRRDSPLKTHLTQPVPKPILLIPQGELTAGDAIILGVKVPPYEGSVYVKLWIQDRQNRTILDGPRTFVDFEFHADGERETLTQVTVPYGSMEIQLDAIAINPQTQQESHKATVECTVVPPDLPSLSLKEFEL